MDDSAPNVVPPTPPVTTAPPGTVGLPLIEPRGDGDCYRLSRHACEAAGREGARLLGPFFAYHTRRDLTLRRLVLATASGRAAERSRSAGNKRKAGPAGAGAGGAPEPAGQRVQDAVPTCGSTFGCTLGIIVAYLEGRGVPAERAHILRSVRTQLLPAAESLRYVLGPDAEHLAVGMASCRVVHAQRVHLPEMGVLQCPRIDHKYGHAGTAVGTTATLIAVFGVMSDVPNHCRHLVHDHSFVKALRCAEATLGNWNPSVMHLPEEHWAALGAERRALQRASLAAREAIDALHEREGGASPCPTLAMRTQLEWARMAAFPSGEVVSEFTQARLCQRIRSRQLPGAGLSASSVGRPPPVTTTTMTTTTHARAPTPGVLPLSEIPAAALVSHRRGVGGGGGGSDTQSCTSSSWRTLSSHSSSNFSHVSQDSLAELADPLGAVGVW